jgi:hypothetical protein
MPQQKSAAVTDFFRNLLQKPIQQTPNPNPNLQSTQSNKSIFNNLFGGTTARVPDVDYNSILFNDD